MNIKGFSIESTLEDLEELYKYTQFATYANNKDKGEKSRKKLKKAIDRIKNGEYDKYFTEEAILESGE